MLLRRRCAVGLVCGRCAVGLLRRCAVLLLLLLRRWLLLWLPRWRRGGGVRHSCRHAVFVEGDRAADGVAGVAEYLHVETDADLAVLHEIDDALIELHHAVLSELQREHSQIGEGGETPSAGRRLDSKGRAGWESSSGSKRTTSRSTGSGWTHLAALDERVELSRKHGLHEGLPVRNDQAMARLLAGLPQDLVIDDLHG